MYDKSLNIWREPHRSGIDPASSTAGSRAHTPMRPLVPMRALYPAFGSALRPHAIGPLPGGHSGLGVRGLAVRYRAAGLGMRHA